MIEHYASTPDSIRQAWFSEDQKYRYCLDICWAPGNPLMTVVGLNPSSATHLIDDPTIRRCTGFAKKWKFGGLRMLNAFALRSTDPKALFKASDPVGPENTLEYLAEESGRTILTLAAWGMTIQSKKWPHYYRGHDIASAIEDIRCFRKTDSGHPEHPLYLPGDLEHQRFSYE